MTSLKKLLLPVLLILTVCGLIAGYTYGMLLNTSEVSSQYSYIDFTEWYVTCAVFSLLASVTLSVLFLVACKTDGKLLPTLIFFGGFIAVSVISVHYVGRGLAYALFSALIPLISYFIYDEARNSRHPLLCVFPIFACGLLVLLCVENAKLAIFVVATLIATALFAAKDRSIKSFTLTAGVLAVLFAVFFVFALSKSNSTAKLQSLISWRDSYECEFLVSVLKDAKMLQYDPISDFSSIANTLHGATLIHLILTFGWLPALGVVLALTAVSVLMFVLVRSLSGCVKGIGFACASMFSIHLALSLASSLSLIPTIDTGLPLITSYWLYYSFVPVVTFIIFSLSGHSGESEYVDENGREKKAEKNEDDSVIVSMSGGPRCGKSTTIRELKKCVNPKYVNSVAFIDESATHILQQFPDLHENKGRFQELIYLRQVSAEEKLIGEGYKYVVTDRSVIDAYAYLPLSLLIRPKWLFRMLHFRCYDHILYFKDLPKDVKTDGKDSTLRIEKDEKETEMISARTAKLFKRFNNVTYIEPAERLEEKVNAVKKILNEKFGAEIFI